MEDEVNNADKLDNISIMRYSRQLILPEIGVKGQLALKQGCILIVGAGGLGCPASIYLAAAGVGTIGIVDYDEVDLSNLHRQILHTEKKVGVQKSTSAAEACQQLNSSVKCVPYHIALDSSTALEIIQQYDVVLDCTDNVATRYLLNDACVLAKKPLVSGSALRFEGQLTIYNHNDGPCYRCLYPEPPPPEMVTNCSDGGVLGVVPGIIGSIQALEAIKIIANIGTSYTKKLLMFDAMDLSFRTIKLRPKSKTCVVCGEHPSLTELIDYEQFCGSKATDKDQEKKLLQACDRISAKDYKKLMEEQNNHLLVDVRLPVELDICRLPHPAINVPIRDVDKETSIEDIKTNITAVNKDGSEDFPVIVVCRKGNDSQVAVQKFKERLKDEKIQIKDIIGGLTAWSKQVDHTFPVY